MSAKKTDISQIEKYLQGVLDAKAMHQLESDAQDDPFLMDAMEGYEAKANNVEADVESLKQKLAKRVAEPERRNILLWRVLPIAASLLLMIGAGWLFFNHQNTKPESTHIAANLPDKVAPQANLIEKPQKNATHSASEKSPVATLAQVNPAPPTNVMTYKEDTVAYIASTLNPKKTSGIEDLLKKMTTLEVDSGGNITRNGQSVTRVRLNGKEFAGGSADQAIKNLPADILQKVQVIDDYGNQASRSNPKGDSVIRGYISRSGKPAPVADNPVGTTEQLLQGSGSGLIIQNNLRNFNKVLTIGKNTFPVIGQVINTYGAAVKDSWVGLRSKPLGKTDANGWFSVTVPADSTLLVTAPGYDFKSVKIDMPSQLYVILAQPKNTLAEVAIVNPQKPVNNYTGAADFRGTVNIRGLSAMPTKPAPAIPVPVGYHIISGSVIDSLGEPLIGASITMFGVGIGVVDRYGEFKVAVPATGEFYVSAVGYHNQMVQINKSANYVVKLHAQIISEGQVVIRRSLPPNFYKSGKPNKNAILAKRVVATPRAQGDTICHENIKFRDAFFGNIGLIEKRIFQKNNGYPVTVSTAQYYKALRFIARYVDVGYSVDKTDKEEYQTFGFDNDAHKWHDWYQANKCDNIQY